jgi:putative membrane protein
VRAVRWAERLRATGTDPDPRFTFANERTFLAWIRTGLALVAAGVGLDAFGGTLGAGAVRKAVSVLLVLLGALASGAAFRRWLRGEQALRRGAPLPPPALAPLLGYGVAVVAVATLAVLLTSR